jgi:HK97 family phage major capsid protein
MQITKIRDYVDVCLDMMNDYSFVEGEIRNLINSSVQLKIDDQFLNGTGTHPETNSLSSISSAWAVNIAGTKDWTSQVTLANLVDLIIVIQSQIQELGAMNKFMPNYVLMNPGDWASLMLIKNIQGDSIKYYPGLYVDAAGNIRINGMLVIPNPNVTVNTLWVGDFSKGTVYNIPGVGIELSYENSTNFETETVTVKAYERLNLLVRTVDTNAFMKVSDINAALALINKP